MSDGEIVDVFRESDDPALTAGEVADEIDMTQQGAGNRLRELVECGELQRKKPGERTAIYWLEEDDEPSSP